MKAEGRPHAYMFHLFICHIRVYPLPDYFGGGEEFVSQSHNNICLLFECHAITDRANTIFSTCCSVKSVW